MPRKKKRQSKPQYKHTLIAVRVENYEVRADAGVHHYVYQPHYAWRDIDDDPLFEFSTHIEITGASIYPEDRAGDSYEITIHSETAESARINAKVKEVQARDEYGAPQYRQYRGKSVPVYNPPEGVGHLNKIHGEKKFTGWVFAPPRFLSDYLMLLGQGRELYLSLHERRLQRHRWLHHLSLQTSDPAEE